MIDRVRIPRESASCSLASSPSTWAQQLPGNIQNGKKKNVSLKVHPLIPVPVFYSTHFSSPFSSTYLRGVFICSGFLFLAHWRFSQDNSSDKYPAGYKHRGAGGRRKSKLRGLVRSRCPTSDVHLPVNAGENLKKVNGKVKLKKVHMENLNVEKFWRFHCGIQTEEGRILLSFKSPILTSTVTPLWSQLFLTLVPEQSVPVSVMKPPLSPDK